MSQRNNSARGGEAGHSISALEEKKLRRKKREQQKKIKKSRRIGQVLTALQLLLTVLFLIFLFLVNLLPFSYNAAIAAVLLLFVIYNYFTQFTRHYRTFGKVFSVILSLVLAVGSIYLIDTNDLLSTITGANYQTSTICVYALKSSGAATLDDVKEGVFGAQNITDTANTAFAVEKLQNEIGTEPKISYYDSFDALVEALYSRETAAIILNEAYVDTIEEEYETFSDDTVILASYENRVQVTVSSASVAVTKEPFHVFISGIDVYGSIAKTSRSDVNIIATVNPNTKEILLTSTPRDSYVELAADDIPAGNMDKLTHAGIYGVDCSISTLEKLYGIQIDYYVRVNFTGFIDIIDALGGITIENESSFTSHDGYYFPAGTLDLDGLHALHYARERKAFALGDVQRGINQMKVIKAIVGKACSSALLENYLTILDSLKDSMETNMSSSDISSLVQMQIKEGMPEWTVTTNYVSGTSASRVTYSVPNRNLSVYVLDADSLAKAKEMIQTILNHQ